MGVLKTAKQSVLDERLFDPHETARVQSLEGALLASFWQRAVAFVIDFLLVLAVYVPTDLVEQYFELKSQRHPIHIAIGFSFHELEDLVWLIVYAGLAVWCTDGFTIGKRLMRIRVVSLKHRKLTLWQSVERALGYGASALEGGFGFIQFFVHHNRQCVHDRIAETIVVDERPQPRFSVPE